MHILDTDTLRYVHSGHPRVMRHLRELSDPRIGITLITKIELLRGRFEFVLKAATGPDLIRAQDLLRQTEELLGRVSIIPVDEKAATQFDVLRLTKGLRKMGRAGLLIASIALANKATLVTRNVRHFRAVPNLRVINWVD